MSTNSTISIINKAGEVKSIYAHWDGYPSNNGKILKRSYNTAKKVNELINLGNVSILNDNIGEKVEFNGFDSTKNQQCLFYGRDRGETGQEAITGTIDNIETQEWNYLFDEGKWYVMGRQYKKFVLLTDEIIEEN